MLHERKPSLVIRHNLIDNEATLDVCSRSTILSQAFVSLTL
jgi:hypothetical protein